MAQPRIPEDPRSLRDLRKLLLDQAQAMKEAMGTPPGINPRLDPDLLERHLAGSHSRPATLALIFLLGRAVPAVAAASALEPVTVEALEQMGLAELAEDAVRPLARITPYEGELVAWDVQAGLDPPDLVTGPSPSARRVEALTIRRPVGTALDLGTGSGIQALRTARHAERVVGVDVNERGLAFGRFNAALNEIANVEFRKGSWLEPVADEHFDLIVANPPYVVSPDSEFLYRDGDLSADGVTQKLLRGVPSHLEEGGFAHVMGNWAHKRDEDWRAPVEAWLAGSGCDVLLLAYATVDPVLYAAQWNRPQLAEGRESFLSTVDRWLDYYRQEGIESITEGMVVLRRRNGRNWVRAIEVPGSPTGAAGTHVARLFDARDRRDELADDDTVLGRRFAAAPGLRLSRRAGRTTVELEQGVGFAAAVPEELAEQIASLDGSQPLGEVVDGAEVAATTRRLFALGLLVFFDATR